uniref:Uncharacterized protein n=2 Tax=Oryza meridionalis TaxID=40149 RepID=A0A0E0E1U4_9ORYZ
MLCKRCVKRINGWLRRLSGIGGTKEKLQAKDYTTDFTLIVWSTICSVHHSLTVDENRWTAWAFVVGDEPWASIFEKIDSLPWIDGMGSYVPLHPAGGKGQCKVCYDKDFSLTCVIDSLCEGFPPISFCEHCCSKHHGKEQISNSTNTELFGQLHGMLKLLKNKTYLRGSQPDSDVNSFLRDAFCFDCECGFAQILCGHHKSHSWVGITQYLDQTCVVIPNDATGASYYAFDGVQEFSSARAPGCHLVPLHGREASRCSVCQRRLNSAEYKDYTCSLLCKLNQEY